MQPVTGISCSGGDAYRGCVRRMRAVQARLLIVARPAENGRAMSAPFRRTAIRPG